MMNIGDKFIDCYQLFAMNRASGFHIETGSKKERKTRHQSGEVAMQENHLNNEIFDETSGCIPIERSTATMQKSIG